MSVLDEANNLVDDKFETKSAAVYQEFRVLVRVSSGTKDAAAVRALLDHASKHFEDYNFSNDLGSVQVVQVEPK